MRHNIHSHCAGDRELPASLQKEIIAAISAVTVKPGKGKARKLRNEFLASIKTSGWSGEIDVSSDSGITITSMKSGVGLCLQTGNMARMYADLIKLQTMYLNGAIRAAAIVVPSQPIARRLGSNIAQANRLERELSIFKKAYHVPTVVFSLE